MKTGARWFYWIAGLSVVNSAIALGGGHARFILGLGVTQVVDTIATQAGSSGSAVSLGLDVIAAAIFALFGYFAAQKKVWAFIVGMILYALDGLLFVLVKDIWSIGFHIFALVMIYRGLKANEKLLALDAAPA